MSKRGNNEGSIRRRPDGRWEARVTIDRKQRSFYARTREEAARKMRKALSRTEKGLPLDDARLTVGDYLDRWLETSAKASVRQRTYDSYEGHIRLHLKPAIGAIRLTKLQPQHVQQLLNDKIDEGLSPNTVLRIRATLRRALNQAMKWGLVSRNVATLIDPPRAEKYRVEALSPDEAKAILDAVQEDRLAAAFTLMLAVGLRLGETLGLHWEDVDLNTGTITIRQSLQYIHGELVLLPPKSESSRRTIPIPDFAVKALHGRRAEQNRERMAAGEASQETDLVFTTSLGTPVDPSNMRRRFYRLLDEAGLERIRIHDLRHAFASLLLAKNVSERVVMETLGHSQIGLTLNTYAHVLPQLQREAAERMDEVLSQE